MRGLAIPKSFTRAVGCGEERTASFERGAQRKKANPACYSSLTSSLRPLAFQPFAHQNVDSRLPTFPGGP